MNLGVVLSALLAVMLWGASPVGTKFAVADLSPIVVAALRTALGGMLAVPMALALRVPLPNNRRSLAALALSAVCGFVCFPVIFSLGMQRTSGVHGAMILALLPVVTGGIASATDRRWPSMRWWLGCTVALIGESLLIFFQHDAGARSGDLVGDLQILLACVFAATGYVAGGRLKQWGYPAQGTTYWGIALATLLIIPALPTILAGTEWQSVAPSAWAGLAYLAVGVSVLGYVCWYWALGRGGIERVAVFQFLQPVSGVSAAILLLDEAFTLSIVAAAAIIVTGVWIATRPPRAPV